MNIYEASTSGKFFKRKDDKHWLKAIEDDYEGYYASFAVFIPAEKDLDVDEYNRIVHADDILSNDWEVKDRIME